MARAATAPARQRTAPAPRPRPAQPRRRSGATVPTRAPSRRTRTAPGIAKRLEVPVSRALDALLHGRAWIVLIGILLVGIVFFNVSLLGLNQGITRDSQRAQALEQQNARLRLQVAGLASTERITQMATKKGMVMPPPGQVGYLRSNVKHDARRAAQRIVAPGSGPTATTTTAAAGTAGTQAAPAPQSATPQSAIQPAQPQAAAPAATPVSPQTTTPGQ